MMYYETTPQQFGKSDQILRSYFMTCDFHKKFPHMAFPGCTCAGGITEVDPEDFWKRPDPVMTVDPTVFHQDNLYPFPYMSDKEMGDFVDRVFRDLQEEDEERMEQDAAEAMNFDPDPFWDVGVEEDEDSNPVEYDVKVTFLDPGRAMLHLFDIAKFDEGDHDTLFMSFTSTDGDVTWVRKDQIMSVQAVAID